MAIFGITAPNAADYAAELGGVIRDAATDGDIWYRSNATNEYISCAFEVTLPAGATINTASINFHFAISSADEPNHTIDAEFVADAIRPAAGDPTNGLSGRTGTTANVNWYNTNLGAPGYFDTPDLAAVFQELVDNFDYSAGATVLIRVYYAGTGGDVGISTPVDTGNPVATLTIDYTDAGGGVSVAVTDSGAGLDGLAIAADVPLTDGGAGVDGLAIAADIPLTDGGAGLDVVSLSVQIAISDSAAGLDLAGLVGGAIIKAVADIAHANDDLPGVGVSLYVTDNGAGVDSVAVLTGGRTGFFVVVEFARRSVILTASKRRVTIEKRTV